MRIPKNSSKSRLKFALITSIVLVILLLSRLAYLQIVKGEDLKKGALEQWMKSIDIKSKRGTIYDRKGKKLAVSTSVFTVWATPADISEPKETAETLSEILDMDENTIYEKITKQQSAEKIKQWITKEEANELRQLGLEGINIVDDNKRYYPYDNFASYILGFTDIDNNGLDGIEKTFDEYLTGVPGKWIKMTDAANRQLPYDGEKIYESQDGNSLVLTLDESIQHFSEKAAQQALVDNKAENVSIIIMEPNTGDILAMANKPDFNPNDPREPIDEKQRKEWKDLSDEEMQDKWYDLWRNFAVTDVYEPGSTFKVITAAAAIEENVTDENDMYHCGGTTKVGGETLKCARWYRPHGSIDFREALNDSCNIAFIDAGKKLGKENLYKYLKAFGFGEKTNIDLLGEQEGIIPANTDVIKEINLATMSYGHGVAITPIQLVSAVSAISNGGNLMEPRIVKELIDDDGEVIKEFPTKARRQVLSKETSDTMLSMMETVVSDGSGGNAIIPGYRVGGKTGTAEKIIDGKYAKGKYIASFVAVAPIDDPQLVALVIVDDPKAESYYGGSVSAPIAKDILEDIFNYLEIPPTEDIEDEDDDNTKNIKVPDVRDMNVGDAGKKLKDIGLKYTTEYVDITSDTTVLDQFPTAGTEVEEESIIDLVLDVKSSNNITIPYLMDKDKEEVIDILDEVGLKYELKGKGKVVSQDPMPGEEVDSNITVIVEFQ
ncbi:MAG TPA: stage V sporulation protein D [Tissierellaceae bacterium]|nr:stage V sporulation protein D [Tissierellaceae bacterium]